MTFRISALSIAFALALAACQGETVGEAPNAGGSTGTGGSTGGVHGPGKYGALPAGYCCTSDSECRFRRCSDFGGTKICSDECDSNDGCNTGQNMTCSSLTGYCEPSGAPACIPADQWVNGTKPTGACCVATGDGHSGQECEANRCVAVGDLSNPFICTQPCSGGCPSGYECLGGLFCAPVAAIYTCQ